jgi:hypothetical protein
MRYLRLALVILLAVYLRGRVQRTPRFDLSASYSSHLGDAQSVERVAAQLHAWEQQLRAHGFNSIATRGASNIRSSASGAEEQTESREVTLVGKLDHLGRVQVRIRTDEDLAARDQAMIELQAQRKSDYTEAWVELGRTVQHLLQPQSR